ncbi:hypothetical protein FXW78_12915 [Rhodococcus opacus]|nr:hypothetical protein [Rhodococcus opacus]RZL85221.1 MAG: hypothetical protein EOP32_00675 [Rhodococcus sp. (in: high G+C Gram-positive bacteria)]
MNRFVSRVAITAAAVAALAASGAGMVSAAPILHGDPNTPGTQLHVTSPPEDSNGYACGALGVAGVGVGTTSPGSTGQLNGPFFGSGPMQGGCVGSDGSVHFPSGHAH